MLSQFLINETNACRANNLNQLLSPKWNEAKNSYRLFTHIDQDNEAKVKRILMQNRYSNKCVD